MKINAEQMAHKIGMEVAGFQIRFLKEITKLKKNPDAEGFKKFRKKFEAESFELYRALSDPFSKVVDAERSRKILAEIFDRRLPTKHITQIMR